MTRLTTILVNGRPSDGLIPITDSTVLRGDGCFEVLRSYGGKPFALGEHLDRLERSARALMIDLPERSEIALWVESVSNEIGDGAIRIIVSRGPAHGFEGEQVVAVFGQDWESPTAPTSLYPLEAPWHPAGREWDLTGVKFLSYAPHMAAVRRARAEGFDDALLLTSDGLILEGPRFSVAWVVDGVLETTSLEIGILDSITRRYALDLAAKADIEVIEGVWPLERLKSASEMMALSTTQEIHPVGRVGELSFEVGSITTAMSEAFSQLVG